MTRVVTMRDEVTESSAGRDVRSLWASINAEGDLVIHGQDLGPGVPAVLSDDSEHEWYYTHRQRDLPALRVVLGAPAGADLLDVICERFCGAGSYTFDALVRESSLRPELWVC